MIAHISRTLPSLGNPPRIGIAVSGGGDSVFLAHALHRLGRAGALLHVNHQLRGAASDADETFVRSLAEQLDLPFYSLVAPITEGNVEQEARRARYTWFAACRSLLGLGAIATGHTLDDQAETVLLRFLRGSGTQGLAGIRPSTSEGIIRPLLGLRRAEIRQWLRDNGLAWREDDTNASTDFDRNRARIQTLPQLERDYNPALSFTLASTADWALAEEDYWSGELDRLAPELLNVQPETVFLRAATLLALPVAVQRRLLRRAIALVRGNLRAIDFQHVESIRALCASAEGSGRIQLPGLEAYRSFDQLRLGPPGFDARLPRNFESPLAVPGSTTLAEYRITIEMELLTGDHVYNDVRDALDSDQCRSPLWVRNWRPGDAYWCRGGTGAVKIKQLFQEFRVPLWERRTWPVIVAGDPRDDSSPGLIVWSRRFGVAEELAAGPGSRNVLLIRESGESKTAPTTSKN